MRGGPNPSLGKGGGAGGDHRNAKKQKMTRNQCRVESLKKNGLALGLDIAGIAVEGILSEVSVPASVVATAIIGVAGIGNSIAHRDWGMLGVTYVGRYSGMAEGFYSARALSFARSLSIGALGYSTITDIQSAKRDYEACIAGQGGA